MINFNIVVETDEPVTPEEKKDLKEKFLKYIDGISPCDFCLNDCSAVCENCGDDYRNGFELSTKQGATMASYIVQFVVNFKYTVIDRDTVPQATNRAVEFFRESYGKKASKALRQIIMTNEETNEETIVTLGKGGK